MSVAKRVKKRLSYMKTDDRNKLTESLKSLKRRYVSNFPVIFMMCLRIMSNISKQETLF